MSVDDLTRLTVRELRKVCHANWILFHTISILNLIVFYNSLQAENWVLLFISFGFFVIALSIYDNYQVSRKYLDKAEGEAH